MEKFNQKLTNWFELIRIHQWIKNILIFLPLLFSHQIDNIDYLLIETIGFFAFSFCASSSYILNDILDLESDQKHPFKKYRPLASKKIRTSHAIIISISLLILSLIISSTINLKTMLLTLIYFSFSFIYSKFIKKIIYFDCLFLSSFYVYRIYFGSSILDIYLSIWLITFAFFLFLSLALFKRYSELCLHKNLKQIKNYRKNYSFKRDIKILKFLGLFIGSTASLILIFYSLSLTSQVLYKNPMIIIFSAFILLFWIFRLWNKGEIKNINDPIEFAINDKISYISSGLIIIIFIFAKFY